MSIIQGDSQICLAFSGETYYDNCGGLLQETGATNPDGTKTFHNKLIDEFINWSTDWILY